MIKTTLPDAKIAFYGRLSALSRIFDRIDQLEAYSEGVLNQDDPTEANLYTQIKRNTNSIRQLIAKHMRNEAINQ